MEGGPCTQARSTMSEQEEGKREGKYKRVGTCKINRYTHAHNNGSSRTLNIESFSHFLLLSNR